MRKGANFNYYLLRNMPNIRQLVILGLLTAPIAALAQGAEASKTYNLLAPLSPYLVGPLDMSGDGLERYLLSLFKIAIGLAGVLAVVMIVVCGIRMMGESVSGKEAAKECIRNALLGLILAIASWALLYTINPALVSTKLIAEKVTIFEALPPPAPGAVDAALPTKYGYYFKYTDAKGNNVYYRSGTASDCEATRQDWLAGRGPTGVTVREEDQCIFVPATPISGDEQGARAQLAAQGIYAHNGPCKGNEAVAGKGCTNLAGLPGEALGFIIALEAALPNPSNCTESRAADKKGPCKVVVTGGTEPGHRTHKVGKSIFDLRATEALNSFMKANAEKVARSFDGPRYLWNGVWLTSHGSPNHWHVQLPSTGSWYASVEPQYGQGPTGSPQSLNSRLRCDPTNPAKECAVCMITILPPTGCPELK